QFNITPKQLREWIKKKIELKNVPPYVKRLNIGARPKYPLLEVDIKNWVKSLRSQQKIVSRQMIRTKAKQLASQPRFVSLYPTINECKWGEKWVEGFMRRNKFSNRRRTTVAQKLAEDLEPLRDEFLSNVLYHRMLYNYPLSLIGNMDETPLAFDVPSNYTVKETGAHTVSIRTTGYEKSNFTVVLGCLADGTKLVPMVIFKLVNVPRQTFPQGIVVRANPEGYMNSDEMIFWIENIWNRRAPLSVNPRSLLVLDSFRGHTTDPVKTRFKEKNTNIAVIPGGLTKKLQPLDVY